MLRPDGNTRFVALLQRKASPRRKRQPYPTLIFGLKVVIRPVL